MSLLRKHTEAADDQSYDAFLSYNSKDRPDVEMIASRLNQEGIRVFFDRSSLSPGERWQRRLEQALHRSNKIVVFLGPYGIEKWQELEVQLAIKEKAKGQIIPVLLPGGIDASGFLALYNRIDLGKDYQNELQRLVMTIKEVDAKVPPSPPREHLLDYQKTYRVQMVNAFKKTLPPYGMEPSDFVDNFDYRIGDVVRRDTVVPNTPCFSFIQQTIGKQPVFCVGNYGMGKTTLARYLFVRWPEQLESVLSIFIKLEDKDLADFSIIKLSELVFTHLTKERCFKAAIEREHQKPLGNVKQPFIEAINSLLAQSKIGLILDGIDEACPDDATLKRFREVLMGLSGPVFVTCRREFILFFDAFEPTDRISWMELRDWGRPQWDVYINHLRESHSDKSLAIKELESKLSETAIEPSRDERAFRDLAKRPLFLKMLTDLLFENSAYLEISQNHGVSLAEVYYEFIQMTLRENWKRKPGEEKLRKEDFVEDVFGLLRWLATKLYRREGAEGGIPIPEAEVHCNNGKKDGNYLYLDDERLLTYLQESTLLSVLRRTKSRRLVFSHNSFMEYLVGHSLAHDIFSGSLEEAHCGDIWSEFQTYEVSEHFISEVDLICIKRGLSTEERNLHLAVAFSRILEASDLRKTADYQENAEEVLYYAGWFEITDEAVVTQLLQIIANPSHYRTVYYRTASLALSKIKSTTYCEQYVLSLIESLKGDREAFEQDAGIQRDYYGKTRIREILGGELEDYIEGTKTTDFSSYKAWAYFTADMTRRHSEREHDCLFLGRIREAARTFKHVGMLEICDEIERILKAP